MMKVFITYKNGFGHKTFKGKVFSKKHFDNLVDKFHNVIDIDFKREEFNNLKEK
tara:strand:- start:283 stop:444 length:162 start_codon:yes stop_codon:yes gene_type:complete